MVFSAVTVQKPAMKPLLNPYEINVPLLTNPDVPRPPLLRSRCP
jgi:hypothetical protein